MTALLDHPRRTCLVPILALAISAVGLTGCKGRLAREGIGYFRGAEGAVTPLQAQWSDPKSQPLAPYTQYELGQFTDAMLGQTPPELFEELRAAWDEALVDQKLLSVPGGKKLLVEGEIIHFEDSTRTLDVMISPFGEVVARVRLIDAQSGQVLAEGNCVGRAKEAVNLGVDKKARGLAKAIAKWIASLKPKPEKE